MPLTRQSQYILLIFKVDEGEFLPLPTETSEVTQLSFDFNRKQTKDRGANEFSTLFGNQHEMNISLLTFYYSQLYARRCFT